MSGQSMVVLGAQEMLGAAMSWTEMVWEQVAVLPQSSVAVQVRLMANLILPPMAQLPGRFSSEWLRLTPPHRSLATGSGKTGMSGQSMVVLGAQEMLGAAVSRTEMVWEQVAVLPQSSVAVQVRLMANLILPPMAQLPGRFSSEWDRLTPPQRSLATGSGKTGMSGQSMVVLGAQEMLGAAMSCTEMVWEHVAVLPQSSVAVQVRLMAYLILPPMAQLPGRFSSEWVRLTPPQRSLASGSGKLGMFGQSMVVLGAQEMLGAAMSWTEMVWEQVAVLPQSSVAVQVRLMANLILPPMAQLPGRFSSEWLRLTPPHRSLATGSGKTGMSGQSMVVLGAQEMLGAAVSRTEMVWEQVAVLPQSSVAVQVRLMAYLILPPMAQLPGRFSSEWVRLAPPHRSLATGSGKLGKSGQSMVVLGAQEMLGAAVSRTEMVWEQVAVLPQSSVAVQVRLMANLILPPMAQLPGRFSSEWDRLTPPQRSLATGSGKTGMSGQSMVVLGAQEMLGAAMSCTEMVWEHVAVLPQSSVSVEVRLVAYLILPPMAQLPGRFSSEWVRLTPPQRSLASGSGKLGMFGQSIVLSGAQEMLGAAMSRTEMVWEQVAVLPQSSVAVQVRLMANLILPPMAQLPGRFSSEWLRLTPPHRSLATGSGKTGMSGQSMVVLGAQEMLGAAVSRTEMVWEQVAVLPQSSVAVQVRLMAYLILPPMAQLPGRFSSEWVRLTPPQRSLASGSGKLGMFGQSMVEIGRA